MSPAFSPICQTLSSLSLITNLYLVYVYFRCPLKAVNSYKYFFLLTAIQDIIYSSCLILVLPVAIVENFSLVFIATGPLYRKEVGQIFMIIFIVVFITSILLVANSFLYRYLQVCRHHFFEHVMAPRNLSITVSVNGAILANWMAVVCISFWPNREFTEHISHKAQEFTGLDPFECAQLGISISHISLLQFLLLAETVVFLSLTVNAILFSAVKIHNTLKRATFSQNMRRLHKQMFTLLLLQSACPFAFLQGPSFINYVFLFSGMPSPTAVVYLTTILLSLFPLLTPIIIIAFLEDYRSHTLTTLRISRSNATSVTVFVSEMKTVS